MLFFSVGLCCQRDLLFWPFPEAILDSAHMKVLHVSERLRRTSDTEYLLETALSVCGGQPAKLTDYQIEP